MVLNATKSPVVKLSLITVSFNSEQTIRATFDSVKMQKREGFDLEYILVDGGSSDRTMAISNEYNEILSLAVSEPDEGLYDAMNKGIKFASGDVIGFLNSDDSLHAESTLADIMNVFQSDEELSIVFGDLNYVNENNEITRKWRTGEQKSFASGWHPAHPAFYAKTNLFKENGGFDTNYKIASDFDLMLRFLEKKSHKAEYLKQVFVNMTEGGESNRSILNIWKGNREILASFKKNGIRPKPGYTLARLCSKFIQVLSKN